MGDIIDHHRGVLPHHQEAQQIVSLTWRLAFTLPQNLIDILQELQQLSNTFRDERTLDGAKEVFQRNYAIKMQIFDEFLGKHTGEQLNLCEPQFAQIIIQTLKFYRNTAYELHAYCLMPNHLHLLIKPLQGSAGKYHKTSDIVRNIKSFSAKEMNKLLGREGAIWQHEYYDRFIRNPADYNRTVEYYLNNPVKAGLVAKAGDWQYSFWDNELLYK
jgi:putative DNA methylase